MPERPLLIFPVPESANRTKRQIPIGPIHYPAYQRQCQRLGPKFRQLQETFNMRRVELLQTAVGIDPEQVLVLETVGYVDNFINAVKKIDGFEWMGEIEPDEISPDEDFFDQNRPEKVLTGRLYLVMTNQKALQQMLSLWNEYQQNPEMKFLRGLTKFRDVFNCLREVRQWDVRDRLHETGILNSWREDLEYDGNRVVRFETELWYRGSEAKRHESIGQVSQLLRQLGGRVVSQCTIDEIAYQALLAELPANAIDQIIQDPTTELVRSENVMFFRPLGQMAVGKEYEEGEVEESTFEDSPTPQGTPIVALLDGLPLTGHRALAGRIHLDDPDDFSENYPAAERRHGTSMASLIIHGDLNAGQLPLNRPLYVRPILKPDPNSFNAPRPETIPHDMLSVDLIHRAVKRMFDGEGDVEATAPDIKVINLSIGDADRQFDRSMSPLARLLDWLSYKYKVIFLVSAGNHVTSFNTELNETDFDNLSSDELNSLIVGSVYKEARNRRLLSPAESINALTVGASHDDSSQPLGYGNNFDLLSSAFPSPVSALGSGYRRAIKPDLVNSGGRQWYRKNVINTNPLHVEPFISKAAPGHKVACPGNVVGELDSVSHSCGTSNATALTTREISLCYEALLEIITEQQTDIDFKLHVAPLLKAMMVHGCSWGDSGNNIDKIIRTADNSRQVKSWISRWLGYGVPDITRSLECSEQRATIIGYGELLDGHAHLYKMPLPPSLGATREWRRLTVTLAWLTPTVPNNHKYRNSFLWFETGQDELAVLRSQADHNAVRRGTLQHEIFEGERVVAIEDGDNLVIKVNCRKDAGEIRDPIPYGLIVSLEVAEGSDISIYDEIRTRIAPAVPIQPSA